MNDNRDNELRTQQLEFFGRILAGFTHDLKNHLAIIKESNGLISDMIAMGWVTDETVAAKLEKIVAAIQGRVGQATDLANNLNSFAHRLDTPLSSFQVNTLLEEELIFLRRFARLKEIDLKIKLHEDLPAIYSYPSLVQYVFFKLFAMALRQLKNRAGMEIASGEENGCVKITITLLGEKEQFTTLIDDESAAAMQEALARMQANVNDLSQAGDEKKIIGLFIPSLNKT
jgi:signal transduction histidine kinase